MRALLHFTTFLTPVAVLALLSALFRSPATLPWVVTTIGLLVSGETLLLARPGLSRLVTRPFTGVAMLLSGVLLTISTPLLGWQQVLAVAGTLGDTEASPWPWLVTTALLVAAGSLLLVTARRIALLPQVLTPIYLVAGGVLLLLALEGRWFRQVVAVLLSVLLAVSLEDVYLAFHRPERHHASAPVNLASYLGLVTYFLYAASLLWLMAFFTFPLWLAALLLAGIAELLTYQALWAIGGSLIAGWPYLAVLPLISVELLWAISFLPTSNYVGALVLTAGYYVASGLTRNQLLGTLHRRVAVRYVAIGVSCLLAVLLTAKCDVSVTCREAMLRPAASAQP